MATAHPLHPLASPDFGVVAKEEPRDDARVAAAHALARETQVGPRWKTREQGTEPRPIVAFAKDWHEDPTSNHHVLRELAKTRRVLWLNSLSTRAPKLGSVRDMGKIRRKLREFSQGAINVENDLWVMTPLVLPLPHSRIAQAVNAQIIRATVGAMRRRLGIDKFDLWTFLPTTADYVGTLGEERSVYYCVDEWSLFSYLDREQIVAAENKLLDKVDAVFAVNDALADAKRGHRSTVHVAPHGVDHALFATALDAKTEIPREVADIPGPRVGFYGTLRDWVDYELIAAVAKARPNISFVLIGQVLTDVGALRGLKNVFLLGQRKHQDLPAYCKGFDVGFIPYRVEERMKFVNPLKLREYLSAGLPVVSTPVPEVVRYRDVCRIASTVDEMVTAIDAALSEGSPDARAARSAAMRSESWEARVKDVMRVVETIDNQR